MSLYSLDSDNKLYYSFARGRNYFIYILRLLKEARNRFDWVKKYGHSKFIKIRFKLGIILIKIKGYL